jgi:hypothetical protein
MHWRSVQPLHVLLPCAGRLNGHTYAVAACAAAVFGIVAAGQMASWPLSSLGHHLARGILVAGLRRCIWATHRVAVPEMIRACLASSTL